MHFAPVIARRIKSRFKLGQRTASPRFYICMWIVIRPKEQCLSKQRGKHPKDWIPSVAP